MDPGLALLSRARLEVVREAKERKVNDLGHLADDHAPLGLAFLLAARAVILVVASQGFRRGEGIDAVFERVAILVS